MTPLLVALYAGIGQIPMPPPSYDPATRPWVLYVEDPDQFCRKVGSRAETHIYACQGSNLARPGQCVIALPKHAPRAIQAKLYRHERAHCNGWDHPR